MAVRTAEGHVAAPRRPHPRLQPLDLVVVALLAAGAAALRAGPLGPSSLWLDDAWTALVVRADSLGDAWDLTVTAPGFGLLLRAWLGVVGFSETAAQVPALVFGVLGPPMLFVVGVRAGLRRGAAGLAGFLLLTAPAHLTFSARVKQYTLDALLVTALLALAWRVLEEPGDRRRWAVLVGGALAATVLTAAVAPVVAAACAAGLVEARRRRAPLRPALVLTGAYAVLGGAWYALVLRPSVSPALRDYWTGDYVDVAAGPAAAARDVVAGLGGVLEAFSALPAVPVGLVLLAAAAWLLVCRPAEAALLAGPLAVAVVLAALRLAPLGGGRTDIYLLPALGLLAAAGVDAVSRAHRRVGVGLVAVAAAATALARPTPSPYPPHDVRPLIAALESQMAEDDVVLVYSASRWAYGLYTGFGVSFPEDPRQGTGFDVAVEDPRVRILDPHRDDPARYAEEVAAHTTGAERVWLLASGWEDDLAVLTDFVADHGFREADRRSRPGGLLVRWDAEP